MNYVLFVAIRLSGLTKRGSFVISGRKYSKFLISIVLITSNQYDMAARSISIHGKLK